MKTRVIDLFCGAGGFSTGAVEVPNVEIVLAVDNDTTYGRAALARHAVHHPNATHLSIELGATNEHLLVKAIAKSLGPKCRRYSGHVHLHGSPPCQDFSSLNMSKKKNNDKNALSRWFICFAKRLGKKLRTRGTVFTASMENVVQCRSYINEKNIETLAANEFGCGTDRRRLFWALHWTFASLKKQPGLLPVQYIYTLKDYDVYVFSGHKWKKKNRDVATSYYNTITTRMGTRVAKLNEKGVIYDERLLTTEELARIQGFPVKYFQGLSSTMAHKMIGNSVCPPLARAVVEATRKSVRMHMNMFFSTL